MVDNFESFISSLSNHELAIYVGYQYDSFLPYSREIVRNEIEKRQLTKNQLDNFYNTKLSYLENCNCCERCGSIKFIVDIDIEHQNNQYTSAELEVKTNRCRLCNHNPSKAEERNIFKRIKRYFFDINKTTKVVRTYYWLDDKPHYPSD